MKVVRERIDPACIHVTGNTVIDALLMTAGRPVPAPIVPSTTKYLLTCGEADTPIPPWPPVSR